MAWSAFKEWRRRFVRSFKNGFKLYWESWLGRIGLGIVIFFVIIAIFAPWIAPYTPEFRAPNIDIFIPYEYPINHEVPNDFNVAVYCTTPSKLDVNGISWVAVYNNESIVLYAIADPVKGRQASQQGGNETGNQTANQTSTTEFTRISPWESAWWVNPNIITITPSELGLQTPLSKPVYLTTAMNPDYTMPREADAALSGLLIFSANDKLVFYDIANQKVVKTVDLGFVPKYVVADPLSSGETSKPPTISEQTSLTGQKIRIPARRFIVCASDNRLVAFRVFYSTSVINQTTTVWVEKFIDEQEQSKFTTEPLVYYNPWYDWKNAIIVGLDNKSTLFYKFDENLTFDKTNYTLLPPIKFYENYELLATPGFKRTTDEPPLYYMPVIKTNNLYVEVYDVFSQKAIKELKIGNYNFATQPDVIDTSAGDAIFFAVSGNDGNKLLRCDYYKEEHQGVVTTKFEISAESDIPSQPLKTFVAPPTTQVFVLTKNERIYVSDLKIENFGVRDYYTANYITKSLKKVDDAKNMIYVGSLKGSKYSIQIGPAETYGIYYNSNKKEITIFKCKGDNIAPLPPGTYPSGHTYWFGTDHEGHDILTYLIYGSRIALLIGISAAFTSTILGTLIGIIAGYYGGWIDTILMRIVDVMLTLPGLPIILIMTSVLGPNVINIVLVLAFLGWAGIARVIRAQTLSLKARPFVDAARVAGASNARIILRHIMPNVLPFTFLYMTIGVSGAILSEAALSFLGLGDPKSITWGQMLSTLQSTGNTMHAWWWLLPPGLCITLISLGFYLIGRAFDEIVNPRLRKR